MSDYIQPANHQFLLDYFAAVREKHQYIDFLDTGIADRERALKLYTGNRLYVPPFFSKTYIDPQQTEDTWPEDILEMEDLFVPDFQKLFLLGDPGVGKTTLVDRISTLLAEERGAKSFQRPMIPFPIVLRELNYGELETFEDLLAIFFNHHAYRELPFAKHKDLIQSIFEKGQAFVFLDGLDEISQPPIRNRISQMMEKAVQKYPDGFWWFTSRIVGFNQERFWGRESEVLKYLKKQAKQTLIEAGGALIGGLIGFSAARQLSKKIVKKNIETYKTENNQFDNVFSVKFQELYIAPFQKEQIGRYLSLWLSIYERKDQQKPALDNFMTSLAANNRIQYLARIPMMLGMMAQYYHAQKHFPDGRIVLYRKISEAYLEELNRKRRIKIDRQLGFNEQIRCMAQLGFQMQNLRDGSKQEVHLTVDRKNAEASFCQTLEKIKPSLSKQEIKSKVHSFFESLLKRSEILTPKAEGEFGFLHLSYQEFFAAEALQEQFKYVMSKRADDQDEKKFWKKMQKFASQYHWHEVLVLFFEGFQEKWRENIGDCQYAFEKIFGWNNENKRIEKSLQLAAAKVMADTYISNSFSDNVKFEVLDYLYMGNYRSDHKEDTQVFLETWGTKNQIYLNLSSSYVFSDENKYRWITAENDAQTIEGIKNDINCCLLDLHKSKVRDLTPLQKLKKIEILNLSQIQVSDFTPICNLKNLRFLDLYETQIDDLSPINEFKSLRILDLHKTNIYDLEPLRELKQLRYLDLCHTNVSDLTPLRNITDLQVLFLSQTKVANIEPIIQMSQLEWLYLNKTSVKDLNPLKQLKKLKRLYLNQTSIDDLLPIYSLRNLRRLYLNGTKVKNLKQLSQLMGLEILCLDQTMVDDLEPIKSLQNLKQLHLHQTPVPPSQIQALQKALPNCKIITDAPEDDS